MIDVKKLAEQAGMEEEMRGLPYNLWTATEENLEAFAALILESAAVECDKEHKRARSKMDFNAPSSYQFWSTGAMFSEQLAAAIRAMKPAKEQKT